MKLGNIFSNTIFLCKFITDNSNVNEMLRNKRYDNEFTFQNDGKIILEEYL